MAGQDSEVSSINSSTSFNSENYSSLLQAFLETHEEANRQALSNNRLKGLKIGWKVESMNWKMSF